MINDNDTILMRDLTDSYCGQLERYGALRDMTRQLMGKLVLSRGDFSAVTDSLTRKRHLLDTIETERGRVARLILLWEERKATIVHCDDSERLETVLQRVTDTIKEFLDDETQLRKYLEGCIARAAVETSR
jgi:hypothetical protein